MSAWRTLNPSQIYSQYKFAPKSVASAPIQAAMFGANPGACQAFPTITAAELYTCRNFVKSGMMNQCSRALRRAAATLIPTLEMGGVRQISRGSSAVYARAAKAEEHFAPADPSAESKVGCAPAADLPHLVAWRAAAGGTLPHASSSPHPPPARCRRALWSRL